MSVSVRINSPSHHSKRLTSRALVLIIHKIIVPHYDVNELVHTVTNHKSKIIEWAQKESKDIVFEIVEVNEAKKAKQFTAQIFIDEEPMEIGHGLSKKKAEQDAARRTLELLNGIDEA